MTGRLKVGMRVIVNVPDKSGLTGEGFILASLLHRDGDDLYQLDMDDHDNWFPADWLRPSTRVTKAKKVKSVGELPSPLIFPQPTVRVTFSGLLRQLPTLSILKSVALQGHLVSALLLKAPKTARNPVFAGLEGPFENLKGGASQHRPHIESAVPSRVTPRF